MGQDPFVVKRNQLKESNNEPVHTSSIVEFRETGPGSPLWPTGLTHAKLVSLTSPCCSDLGTARPSHLARVGPGLWPLSDWGSQGKIARHMQIFSNTFSCLENVFFIQISLKIVPNNGLVPQMAIGHHLNQCWHNLPYLHSALVRYEILLYTIHKNQDQLSNLEITGISSWRDETKKKYKLVASHEPKPTRLDQVIS